jgi:hypothetical protein
MWFCCMLFEPFLDKRRLRVSAGESHSGMSTLDGVRLSEQPEARWLYVDIHMGYLIIILVFPLLHSLSYSPAAVNSGRENAEKEIDCSLHIVIQLPLTKYSGKSQFSLGSSFDHPAEVLLVVEQSDDCESELLWRGKTIA